METKLRRLIIGTIVGTFVLLVGIIVGWNMMLMRPLKESITAANSKYEEESAEANKLASNLSNKVKNERNLELVKTELENFRTRFRAINFDLSAEKREQTWKGIMTEYSREFGIALRDEIVAAANESGVDVNTSAEVRAPYQKPEDILAPGGFLKPVTSGSINVALEARSFNDILRFLNRINKSTILMTVGNIKLEGYAPNIKATLSLTPYLLTKGPDVKLPEPAAPQGGEGGEGGQPNPEGASQPADNGDGSEG